MANNDITDFLLKEYENVAQAFFNSYEVAAKWVRYYLIILAFPFSFVAIIYSDKKGIFDLFNLPNSIAILICLIGLLCLLISYIIIDLRLDSVLYARTVNGIRKYFVDQEKNLHNDNAVSNILDECIVLPTNVNKPSFFKYHGDLFFLALFMSIVNASYISFGLIQVKQVKELNLSSFSLFLSVFSFFALAQIWIFEKAAKKKESDYCKVPK